MVVKASKAIVIDIGTTSVKMLRTNGSGVVKAVSETDWPGRAIPDGGEGAVDSIASTLIACAKKGRIGKGKCVLLLGGPTVILRYFVWPKMPEDALYENALLEIASYLARPVETYVIDFKVLDEPDENKQNVLVAAIDRGYIQNMIAACNKAGFSPARIDLRENAREKLAHADFVWRSSKKPVPGFDPNGSYAFVDVGPELSNVTVFIDGAYSVNRYITILDAKVDDIVSEIGSVINYASYSKRKAKASSVILLRDGSSGMTSLSYRLANDIELPINKASAYVSEFFRMELRFSAKIPAFVDAFAATLQAVNHPFKDFNLIPRKEKKYIFRRIVLPILLTLSFVSAGLFAGIYFPGQEKLALAAQINGLDKKISSLGSISQPELEGLAQHVKLYQELELEYGQLFDGAADISRVLTAAATALPQDTRISSLSGTGLTIALSGRAPAAAVVAEYKDRLNATGIFSNANVESVQEVTIFTADKENPVIDVTADKHVVFTINLELAGKPAAEAE